MQEFDITAREERPGHLLLLLTEGPTDGRVPLGGAIVRHLTSDQLLHLGTICQSCCGHSSADFTAAAQRCFTLALHALLTESTPRYNLISQVRHS